MINSNTVQAIFETARLKNLLGFG